MDGIGRKRVFRGALGCDRRGEEGKVRGGTGPFSAGVDGERRLATLGAKRVARVPIE